MAAVPHLEAFDSASARTRWHAAVNNHLRRLLWEWYVNPEEVGMARVEFVSGRKGVANEEKALAATSAARRVFMRSNNGEDFSRFVDWVTGYELDVRGGKLKWIRKKDAARPGVVAALMDAQDCESAVAVVWREGFTSAGSGKAVYLKA